MKNAFTMIELIFVIIVIGILSVVAVPKLAPLVGNAKDTKAKSTLASVRSAVSTERQKQILQGQFAALAITNDTGRVFSSFTGSGDPVLEYDIEDCTHKGCWHYDSNADAYIYYGADKTCTFKLTSSNRFDDNTTGGCTTLVQ